jgi:hypothetical protein
MSMTPLSTSHSEAEQHLGFVQELVMAELMRLMSPWLSHDDRGIPGLIELHMKRRAGPGPSSEGLGASNSSGSSSRTGMMHLIAMAFDIKAEKL